MKTADQVARLLWAATWGTRERAPRDDEKAYWNVDFWNALDTHGTDEMHPPVAEYADKRALGWLATGDDVPPFGPYAQPPSELKPVPPYPGEATDQSQPPTEPLVPASLLGDVLTQLAALQATVDMTLLAVQGLVARVDALPTSVPAVTFPRYTGSITLPLVGTRTLTLDPQR